MAGDSISDSFSDLPISGRSEENHQLSHVDLCGKQLSVALTLHLRLRPCYERIDKPSSGADPQNPRPPKQDHKESCTDSLR